MIAAWAARLRHRPVLLWLFWLVLLVAVTAAFVPFRQQIDKVNVAFALLLIVLGGSAAGGRALGLTLAGLCYLDFHLVFVSPYYSLVMAQPRDGLVLVAFLVTSVVAQQLLTRALERAEVARQRAVEVERLGVIGAETLNAGRAEDALNRILEVIRTEVRVSSCDIVEEGDAVPAADATAGDRVLRIPLTVRGRSLGVLRLMDGKPIVLAPSQRRFLDVLSYYAALGLERVHLVAEAERAEAFRQADALKAALIASLSHDLRTPLTTIKALASKLRDRALPEATSIEEEADRLNRLVTDLLDLSRLNAKAMPIHLELNMAEDLIGATVQRVAGASGSHRLVIVHGDGPAAEETAERSRFEPLAGEFDFVQSLRALVNLVENALKYSPADAPVELGAVRAGPWLEFRVADRGPGVVAAERQRVFEPFYRAPGVPADVGGAGLGLAIASRLAMEQGGEVRHEERAGGGSVFTLVLRAADVSL
ncbi:MAG: sensor histidine kinase [Gemmatimonadaceae bacterium]